MEVKIGVYICHCGSNIAGSVDVSEVRKLASTLPDVVVARDYQFMCSDPGQQLIKKDIEEKGVNRVVIAACSPDMHHSTFQRVCKEAGLNPHFLQMANIREQCSWVHSERAAATRKACALVRAAVKRVRLHEPLQPPMISINPNVLIIGGGIAGIEAALQIADSGTLVYLVERQPSIGGHMAKFDKTFPTLDCAACILTPKMVALSKHPNIRLMTYSEIEEVSGYVGNFRVKVRRKARSVDPEKCTGCGLCIQKCPTKNIPNEFEEGLGTRTAIYIPFAQAVPNTPVIDRQHCLRFTKGKCGICEKVCPRGAIDYSQEDRIEEISVGTIIVATGYKVFDPKRMPQYGYGRYPNVYTRLQVERLLSSSGPTKGRLILENGKEPRRVAIIHCVGSRDENHNRYCSRVCCMYALKFAHLIRERSNAEVYQFYIDMRTSGKGYEEFYQRVLEEGSNVIRGKVAEVLPAGRPEYNGAGLVVRCEDTLLGKYSEIPVDMVILCNALEPQSDAEKLRQLLGLSSTPDGFLKERHPKLDPTSTATDGIFLAGCCQGPKDIPDTVAQAGSVAGRVLSLNAKGYIEAEPVQAYIRPEACAGCKLCTSLCPYGAISYIEERRICEVNEAQCKGCGTCAASCPAGAINAKGFSDEQVFAEIEGILTE